MEPVEPASNRQERFIPNPQLRLQEQVHEVAHRRAGRHKSQHVPPASPPAQTELDLRWFLLAHLNPASAAFVNFFFPTIRKDSFAVPHRHRILRNACGRRESSPAQDAAQPPDASVGWGGASLVWQ
jgi:hypothetical protein